MSIENTSVVKGQKIMDRIKGMSRRKIIRRNAFSHQFEKAHALSIKGEAIGNNNKEYFLPKRKRGKPAFRSRRARNERRYNFFHNPA